jgi:hypothetical protein
MKFHCLTPEQKYEAELKKELARALRWTRHFLWKPKRFGEECRWLEFYWIRYPKATIQNLWSCFGEMRYVRYREEEISFKKPLDK